MAHSLKKSSFPITVVVLFLAAIFTFTGEAQQPTAKSVVRSTAALKPIVGVAVGFAETEAVRDMPDYANAPAALGIGDSEGEEKNPENNYRKKPNPAVLNAPSVDAALPGRPGGPSAPIAPSAVTTPLVTFDGMVANDGIT